MTAAARDAVICLVPRSTLAIWVAPLVGVVTTVIAGAIALRNIDSARQLARRRATLDLIEKVESSEHYRGLTDAFRVVRKTGSFAHLVAPRDAASRRTRGQVLDYLNHYELVAIGIRQEILDGGMYRAWMESAFVRDWNAAADWVQATRLDTSVTGTTRYDDRAFANYQWMAREWAPRRAVWLTPQSPPLVHVDAPPVVSAQP